MEMIHRYESAMSTQYIWMEPEPLHEELPHFLVVENLDKGFSGVLDTVRGLLWQESDDMDYLKLIPDWKLSVEKPQVEDITVANREAMTFWRSVEKED